MTMKIQQLKTYEISKNNSKREVYSSTTLLQEIRKTSNRQPNFTPKTTGKKNNKKNSTLVEGKKS